MKGCAAASVQRQLQLEVRVSHAYFTIPLRHQVSAVSLFHVIFLAPVFQPVCFSLCVCVHIVVQHILHSFGVIWIKLLLLHVSFKFRLQYVSVSVCVLERKYSVHVCVGLAHVAERHSVRDLAYLEVCCNPRHSWNMKCVGMPVQRVAASCPDLQKKKKYHHNPSKNTRLRRHI